MVTRSYGGVPAEQRRAVRRTALVDAALDCLHEGGLAAVGVRSVCARAQLTQRYFYENFADVDALLVAAMEASSSVVVQRTLAAIAAAGPRTEDQVRAAVATGFGAVADDPRAASMFLAAAAGQGSLRDRRHEIVEQYADLLLTSLAALTEIGPGDRLLARATALFLMGGTVELIEGVLSGRVAMSRARVVELLSSMWLGSLSALPAGRQTVV